MKKETKITLSVDCMGGDNSIDDIIGGVSRFCSENNSDNFLLHGNKKVIGEALDKYPKIKQMCKIRHCDKVIEMEDHKLKLVDDFISNNKNQFSPIEFYLLDKLKK